MIIDVEDDVVIVPFYAVKNNSPFRKEGKYWIKGDANSTNFARTDGQMTLYKMQEFELVVTFRKHLLPVYRSNVKKTIRF
jgi:hypothetical protein